MDVEPPMEEMPIDNGIEEHKANDDDVLPLNPILRDMNA